MQQALVSSQSRRNQGLVISNICWYVWAMPPFGFDDTFECAPVHKEPVNAWTTPIKVAKLPLPDYANDENLKKQFGIELGKGFNPFEAASVVAEGNAAKALWISTNWLGDPIVIGSKDAYSLTVKEVSKPLDKEQLLAKILEFSDERDTYGRPLIDAKERLSALNLYAEILGFKGKNAEITSGDITNNTFNKITKVVLVSPNIVKQDTDSNAQSKMQNVEIPSLPLKLVGGVSR